MFNRVMALQSQLIMFPLLFLGGFLTSSLILPTTSQEVSGPASVSSQTFSFLKALGNSTVDWLTDTSIIHVIVALIAISVIGGVALLARNTVRSAEDVAAPVFEPQPLTDGEKIEIAGIKLNDELLDVMNIIEAYVGVNDRYSASLEKAHASLPRRVNSDQVRRLVRTLVVENQKFQQHSEELREKLEHSKTQIDELRADLSKAQSEGLRDPLTSLGNRRLFDKVLVSEIDKARDQSTDLTLVMADIDHFKTFNDTYGHQVGDEVLKVFANLMETNTKGQDTVARYGGEEFAIILPRTDTGSAYQLVEQIRRKLETKKHKIVKTGETVSKLTASFGISKYQKDDTVENLVGRADAKLYQAKKNGRNCIVVDNSTPE